MSYDITSRQQEPAPLTATLYNESRLEPLVTPLSPAMPAGVNLLYSGSSGDMNQSATVRQMVAERPGRARVLERWGIPYCCGANQTLAQVCAQRGFNWAHVKADLDEYDRQSTVSQQAIPLDLMCTMSLAELSKYIVEEYHDFLSSEIPLLAFLLNRLVETHGGQHGELWELQRIFQEFQELAEAHLRVEAHCLFPNIPPPASSGADHELQGFAQILHDTIPGLRNNHKHFYQFLHLLRDWVQGFLPSETSCNTYRVVLNALGEVELRLSRCIEAEETLYQRALEE